LKFCDDHWEKLRQAVKDRGLWHLVARSGQEATERVKDELGNKETDATWDPLMACHWAVNGNALKMGGLYLLQGDLCQICEAIKHGCGDESLWINRPADDALAYAKEHGLIPTPGVPLEDEKED
jgi:hypothetical protein